MITTKYRIFPSTIDSHTPRGIAPFKIPVSTPLSDKVHHYVIEVTAGPDTSKIYLPKMSK
jgi:hypothetical protein